MKDLTGKFKNVRTLEKNRFEKESREFEKLARLIEVS